MYTKPSDFLDSIICINLDRRTDRWIDSEKQFSEQNLTVIRQSAIDGTTLQKHQTLLPGELGCRLSHEQALQYATTRNKPVLILEDDVNFVDDFQDKFATTINRIPPWELLYLGGNHVIKPIEHSLNIVKPVRIYTTGAYIITPDGAQRLLTQIKQWPNVQIDVAYANSKLPTYAFYPSIATQRPSFSDIQSEYVNYTNYII